MSERSELDKAVRDVAAAVLRPAMSFAERLVDWLVMRTPERWRS